MQPFLFFMFKKGDKVLLIDNPYKSGMMLGIIKEVLPNKSCKIYLEYNNFKEPNYLYLKKEIFKDNKLTRKLYDKK